MKKLKSKIATWVLAICSAVTCMFMLTACSHTHTLTKVDAVPETCTTDGNTHYYTCDCGKYFSDEMAEIEILKDSWVIAKTGHSYVDTWTYDETHHWKEATCSHTSEKGNYAEHSFNDNGECECGYNKYTVDDNEAWNEVLAGDYLDNVTLTIDSKYYINSDGDLVLVDEQSGVGKYTSQSAYMYMYQNAGEYEYDEYLVNQQGTWFVLNQVDGIWYGAEEDPAVVESYYFAGGQGIFFVDRFEAFEYNEENHCYVAYDYAVGGVSVDYVKIYIENEKIIKYELEQNDETSSIVQRIVFSDYGTTTVDVPEWISAHTVADNETWNEVMTGDYLDNVTITVDKNYYSDGVLVPRSISEIARYTSQSMYQYLFSPYSESSMVGFSENKDGTWYSVKKVDDVWYGREVEFDYDKEDDKFPSRHGFNYVDKFNEFEYDEENHCYVANDYSIVGVYIESRVEYVKIYIENGKLFKIEIKGEEIVEEEGKEVVLTTYLDFEFSNYGTTVIDVPEWIPAPQD